MEHTSEIQTELAKLLDTTEIPKHLEPEQYREVLADLELSIIIELSTELLENLTPDSKALLEEENFQGYNELLLFLKNVTAPDAYMAALARAVDGVLGEFLTKSAV